MKTIYLDHAAATPMSSAVKAAMEPYFSTQFYNPSATYLAARAVRQKLEDARAEAAKLLGVNKNEIIFTAGATEANNLAIHGVMQHFPGKKVLVSAIEHDSVLATAKNYAHAIIPVDGFGIVNVEALESLIDDDTVLVSVMWANNEIGTLQPLASINQVLRRVREARASKGNLLPLYLHSDGAQALNYLAVHPHRLGVDLLSLNGGKIYGPKQSGLLFVAKKVELDPLIYGGGQERGLRSGTENVPAIIGLVAAIRETVGMQSAETERLAGLQQYFTEALAIVPGATITNASKHKLPNIVHVSFEGQDNERLMMELDERGIQCAVGSACSASSDEPSHVLKAIGFSDTQAQSSLRFSMGRGTSKQDLDRVISALKEIIHA